MDYNKDYYLILQTNKNATQVELRASYRRLAKLYHPDKNPENPEAEEKFKAINEAYEVLSSEITRHIYDDYRNVNDLAKGQKRPTATTHTEKTNGLNTRVRHKTTTIVREKRVFVAGKIHVKFQGDPEIAGAYMAQREQNFKISPTEVAVTITSSGIYQGGIPRDFQDAYSSMDLFAVPLPQPVRCQILTSSGEEFYFLTLHDIKVKNAVIKGVTNYEQTHFGELTGEFYGYVVHIDTEDVTEAYTEYFGPTGKVETKEEAGVYYSRDEFYQDSGKTYWADWKARPEYGFKKKNSSTINAGKPDPINRTSLSWILALLIGIITLPKLFLTLGLLYGILLLLFLGSRIFILLGRLLPFVSALLISLFLYFAVRSFLVDKRSVIKPDVVARNHIPEVQKAEFGGPPYDTLISHTLQWKDYDSNEYVIRLSVLLSSLKVSTAHHDGIPDNLLSRGGPGSVYSSLLSVDYAGMQLVNRAFDSIIGVRQLGDLKAAEMIVSCIQSLPFYLVLNKSCDAEYNDPYISGYLSNCRENCCIGYKKFGVQSPVEFISNLKGDCDTRSLVLFEILANRGCEVALLTSSFYKHAMIAVHFANRETPGRSIIPFRGENFAMWETTSAGNRPGVISPAISNLRYWNISLLNHK